MEVTKERLLEQYDRLETKELIELRRAGTLTDLGSQALDEELARRGVSARHLREAEQTERVRKSNRDYYEGLPKALGQIKSAVAGLYAIAALQCLASIGFRFWLGVAFGLVLAILTLVIQMWKEPMAGVIVALLGGVTGVVNLLGPLVTGARFGSLVLSAVTVWLGVRCYKAACLWHDVTPLPSNELQAARNCLAESHDTQADATEPDPVGQGQDWFERALTFQNSHNYGDAIEAYSKALEADPNHAAAYFNRAFLYTKLRRVDSALRDLKAAARLGHSKSQRLLKSKGIPW